MKGIFTKLAIGNFDILRAAKVQLISHRYAPIPICIISLQDPEKNIFQDVPKNASISIETGYRGGDTLSWNGYVKLLDRIEDKTIVYGQGVEKCLEKRLSQVWLNESPENIVKQIFFQTGLAVGKIQATNLVFPKFIAKSQTLWELLNQCLETLKEYSIDTSRWSYWLGQDGFNWGTHDEPSEEIEILSGDNLISSSEKEIHALLLPGLKTSQCFKVIEKNSEKKFRAIRVIHEISEIARTYITTEAADG